MLEPTITARDRLTWAPEHVANLGLNVKSGPFTVSAQGHYQGRVFRRDSDRFAAGGSPTPFSVFRPASVAPWFRLDARASYRPWSWLRFGLQGSNLLDVKGYLVKTGDYPFDFRIEGIRVLGTLELATPLGH